MGFGVNPWRTVSGARMGCSERFTRDAAAPKPLRARRGVLMGAGGSHRPCGCPAPARRCTSRSHAGMGGLGFGASHPRHTVRSAQGCSERLRHAYALCMLHVHVPRARRGILIWARAASRAPRAPPAPVRRAQQARAEAPKAAPGTTPSRPWQRRRQCSATRHMVHGLSSLTTSTTATSSTSRRQIGSALVTAARTRASKSPSRSASSRR